MQIIALSAFQTAERPKRFKPFSCARIVYIKVFADTDKVLDTVTVEIFNPFFAHKLPVGNQAVNG
jgi:hypothetical protein